MLSKGSALLSPITVIFKQNYSLSVLRASAKTITTFLNSTPDHLPNQRLSFPKE
jgi:hypothetical protein